MKWCLVCVHWPAHQTRRLQPSQVFQHFTPAYCCICIVQAPPWKFKCQCILYNLLYIICCAITCIFMSFFFLIGNLLKEQFNYKLRLSSKRMKSFFKCYFSYTLKLLPNYLDSTSIKFTFTSHSWCRSWWLSQYENPSD